MRIVAIDSDFHLIINKLLEDLARYTRTAFVSYLTVIAKSKADCVSTIIISSLETTAISIPFSFMYSIFMITSPNFICSTNSSQVQILAQQNLSVNQKYFTNKLQITQIFHQRSQIFFIRPVSGLSHSAHKPDHPRFICGGIPFGY